MIMDINEKIIVGVCAVGLTFSTWGAGLWIKRKIDFNQRCEQQGGVVTINSKGRYCFTEEGRFLDRLRS